MKAARIRTFYIPAMSLDPNVKISYARSPSKPQLLMEFIERAGLASYLSIESNFAPFSKEDFYIAHTREMVDNFFDRGKTSRILHIKWSPGYAESVRYTNAGLYHALRHAVMHPGEVTFTPAGGFHHATPTRGALFCAFSGQVIASVKIWQEFGLCGAYIDLDGHYGNSIDNSRDFVRDLDKAISPLIGNINISSSHQKYLDELKANLDILSKEIIAGRVHYVVFCHGADSHEWDELASQLSTEEWIECSTMVYTFIKEIQQQTGRQIPLTLVPFGGYRSDHYDSVLSLHTADLVSCLNILCGHSIGYSPDVRPRQPKPE